MGEPSLVEIATELYAMPPAQFIASRNAHAKDAADAGLAAQIRALRKPSVAAWVVNVFAQERAARLGEAVQLAGELREAQADLDAPALAQLSRQRRALTAQLAREAAGLASARGEKISPSTLDSVQQTIAAAFFDADAASAVVSGRLVRELEAGGELADLDAAVGGGSLTPATPVQALPDEVTSRRIRREAEARVHSAEEARRRAMRDAAKAADDAHALERRIEDLTDRERAVQSQLADVRAALEQARADIDGAAERQKAAADASAAAERALADAQTALERLVAD